MVSDLPEIVTNVSVEDYSPRDEASTCDPSPKLGVSEFRAFVLEHLGGTDLGICRECGQKPSEHYEGRAWDWGVRTDRPEDVVRVEKLMAWLLAPGAFGELHANVRRVGLRYMIWDGRIWTGGTRSWLPYSGASPHRDHVHFSFGWDGALGQTSFYNWLKDPTGATPPPPAGSPWLKVALVAGSVATGWVLSGKLVGS